MWGVEGSGVSKRVVPEFPFRLRRGPSPLPFAARASVPNPPNGHRGRQTVVFPGEKKKQFLSKDLGPFPRGYFCPHATKGGPDAEGAGEGKEPKKGPPHPGFSSVSTRETRAETGSEPGHHCWGGNRPRANRATKNPSALAGGTAGIPAPFPGPGLKGKPRGQQGARGRCAPGRTASKGLSIYWPEFSHHNYPQGQLKGFRISGPPHRTAGTRGSSKSTATEGKGDETRRPRPTVWGGVEKPHPKIGAPRSGERGLRATRGPPRTVPFPPRPDERAVPKHRAGGGDRWGGGGSEKRFFASGCGGPKSRRVRWPASPGCCGEGDREQWGAGRAGTFFRRGDFFEDGMGGDGGGRPPLPTRRFRPGGRPPTTTKKPIPGPPETPSPGGRGRPWPGRKKSRSKPSLATGGPVSTGRGPRPRTLSDSVILFAHHEAPRPRGGSGRPPSAEDVRGPAPARVLPEFGHVDGKTGVCFFPKGGFLFSVAGRGAGENRSSRRCFRTRRGRNNRTVQPTNPTPRLRCTPRPPRGDRHTFPHPAGGTRACALRHGRDQPTAMSQRGTFPKPKRFLRRGRLVVGKTLGIFEKGGGGSASWILPRGEWCSLTDDPPGPPRRSQLQGKPSPIGSSQGDGRRGSGVGSAAGGTQGGGVVSGSL